MKMKLHKLLGLILAAALFLAAAPALQAKEPLKVPTAWMDEHETFLIWYAKEKGWDKEAGLDLDIQYFSSGMDIVNALPSKTWVFAGNGAVPAVMAGLRYDSYVIANGNDESYCNGVLVRPDSPIAKVKGWNPKYPEVLGSPETVRGKTFLCTTMSSSHYALSSWLHTLGLTDKDVVIKNMDQPQALGAFENGIGDGVSLWAPHMYVGEGKGWKMAGTIKSCGKALPIVLLADKAYADANPEVVAKFLGLYLRAVDMLQKEPLEKLVPEYQRFFQQWAGKEYSAELALLDLKSHPVFNINEQLVIFDPSKGLSEAQVWQKDIAEFFTSLGRLTPEEYEKVKNAGYVTDKFLKQVKQPLPSYK